MSLEKPLLIYDGDCGFCRRWIERWRRITSDKVEYAPYQEVAGHFPQISQKQFQASVIFIDKDKKIFHGVEAVFRSLAVCPSKQSYLWAYQNIPGFKGISEFAYKKVASHRQFFSRVTQLLWGKSVLPSSYALSTRFFISLIGLIYLIAFISLGVQIRGLFGSHGVAPIHSFLEAVANQNGIERFWFLPTLAWVNSSDLFLQLMCWGGALSGALVVLNFFPAFFLLLAWVLYLSFVSIGRPFLSFQWDILLLEAGFLSIFLSLLAWDGKKIVNLLLKFLLLKLMFLSCWVKLASQDAVWKDLTALTYHYQTQPLPPWTAWYAHHLPLAFQRFSCVAVFFIELIVPFFIFFPRNIRHCAAWILIAFQFLIMLTGNYTFFNLLTLVLCLLLFDDESWNLLKLKKRIAADSSGKKCYSWSQGTATALAVVIFLMYLGMFRIFQPFYVANRYGLFAVMTTQRNEIILEGSDDGKEWKTYEFKYKPGDVSRMPSFAHPHQPRLDWQMWFASLGNARQNPWFVSLIKKLLEGEKDVLNLLGKNPFPGHPPLYIRALFYEYHFTDAAERKNGGAWWKRELKGLYFPPASLKS